VGFVESGLALVSHYNAPVVAGRYRLDAVIGTGGAADVHRGFDLRLRRPVAVKIFRPGTGFDTEEDFRGEAEILARLEHPGVVSAYDAGRHGGDGYLVMQLVDGPTLKARIAEGPLPCRTVAVLGAALADALAHAHGAGVLHRDVKPSNILLDASGRPHLSDFGISRLLDATTRTASGTLTGTAAYLSPEQVTGRPVGLPADVYALGLVLLECLTGRIEYDGGPLEAAIARLYRPPAVPADVPADFAVLLRDMTDLDEYARPPAERCARQLALIAASSGPATEAALPVPGSGTGLVPAPEAARSGDRSRAASVKSAAAPVRRRVRMAGAAVAFAAAVCAVAVTEGTAGFSTGGEQSAPVKPHTQVEDTPKAAGAPPAEEQPDVPRTPTGTAAGQGAAGAGTLPAAESAQPRRTPTHAHTPATPGRTKAADHPPGHTKRRGGSGPGRSDAAQQAEQRKHP